MQTSSVAQVLAQVLCDAGVSHVFAMSGGAALHLIHAFNSRPDCEVTALNHEQMVGAAADGFARASQSIGCAIATSGPGAINLLTAIAGAYYDSVPSIFLTGQVSRTRMQNAFGLRQYGFQETPITQMAAPVTKGAFSLLDPHETRRIVEEAIWLAKSGRPGPVLIDIPDDVQRVQLEVDSISGFQEPAKAISDIVEKTKALKSLLGESDRPVVVAGAGVMRLDLLPKVQLFLETLQIPVVRTWGTAGLFGDDSNIDFGYFGTHGSRASNVVVQNSDLVISLGSRLDTKATGSPPGSFAREARKVVVDLDPSELDKFERLGVKVDLPINCDLQELLDGFGDSIPRKQAWDIWLTRCSEIQNKLTFDEFQDFNSSGINPYQLITKLSESIPDNASIVLDTGLSLPFAMSAIRRVKGQRVYHDLNNTAMGWSIGAAVGIKAARPEAPLYLISGDGSLALGLSDLATLAARVRGVKLVLLDNQGHGMIRQTQDQWFDGNYVASSTSNGLNFPNWELQAKAANMKYVSLETSEFHDSIHQELESHDSVLFHVRLDPAWHVRPQVLFGFPIEDQDPPLPRHLLNSVMLVDLLPQSELRNITNKGT